MMLNRNGKTCVEAPFVGAESSLALLLYPELNDAMTNQVAEMLLRFCV